MAASRQVYQISATEAATLTPYKGPVTEKELLDLKRINPYKKYIDILTTALRVLERSKVPQALERITQLGQFERTETLAEKQVSQVLSSESYKQAVATEREVVEITTVVRIERLGEEVVITSNTQTKQSVAQVEQAPALLDILQSVEPTARGVILEKLAVDKGELRDNNSKAFGRQFNDRVRYFAYIDGYEGDQLIELKNRQSNFTVDTRNGLPLYDLLQLAVILYTTESPTILMIEKCNEERKDKLYTFESDGLTLIDKTALGVEHSINLESVTILATRVLDYILDHMELITDEVVKAMLQAKRPTNK